MLDIFKSDAFGLTTLTDAVNKAPYAPGRIGELNLFVNKGVPTKTVVIEERAGRLSLIQTSPRGGPASSLGESKRKARSFAAQHLQRDRTIPADELQDVRLFGSEDQAAGIQQVMADTLADLRQMHEVTHEHMRVGAIQGLVKDADGTTIHDLFDEFGVTQQTAAIDISAADVRNEVVAAKRLSERALGAVYNTQYRALCGDHFFDAFSGCAAVRATLDKQESLVLRNDLRDGFLYGGVIFENYRGRVGADLVDADDETLDVDGDTNTPFIADGEAYLVPMTPDIFRMYFAPADFNEAVNRMGLPLYAKQAVDPEFQRWVKVHTQSNPLAICLRPRAVVKLTIAS